MARGSRIKTEMAIYHITLRGNGRQLLFDGDDDRLLFLNLVRTRMDAQQISVVAWCLMSNHVHLLLFDPSNHIADAMRSLGTSYAQYFNKKHGHVGHVFQGRYGSKPIADERHLMEAVRYIHANPREAGVSAIETYPWSSYGEYANPEVSKWHICNTKLLDDVFGSVSDFSAYMHDEPQTPYEALTCGRIAEDMLPAVASSVLRPLGIDSAYDVAALPVAERNATLVELRNAKFSVPQIERLTGIGRATIYRATRK